MTDMSADNWTGCPWCLERLREDIQKSEDILRRHWASMDPDQATKEWQELRSRQSLVPADPQDIEEGDDLATCRENYEFFWEDGKVNAKYRAWCEVDGCGFDVSLEHSVDLPVFPKSRANKGA